MKDIQAILEILTKINTTFKYAYLDSDNCVRSEDIISLIQELKGLEGKSCRNCKYCPEDCDDDGEWYCEYRDKSIELDFSCEEWIAE